MGSGLAILGANYATRRGGQVFLTRKFVDGMDRTAALWDGPVTAFVEEESDVSDDIGWEAFDPKDLAFGVEVGPFEGAAFFERVRGLAAVVNAGLTHRAYELSRKLPDRRVVWTAELTLRTRLDIIRAEESRRTVRLRRSVWDTRQEWRNTRAVADADGVQCNGVPIYETYAPISRSPLLYYDTRLSEDALPTDDELEARLRAPLSGAPLRLVYTGRLIRIKGVDHLPRVARRLRQRNVPFQLTLFGAGDLEDTVRREIERYGLGDCVELGGTLPFSDELFPLLKREFDLFVCCHRQGDPSCTYLETFGAGIPIVGYDNEAFEGLLERIPAGSSTPMEQIDALADAIEKWHRGRDRLADASRSALAFARQHTFEATFQRRIDHLREPSSRRFRRRLRRQAGVVLRGLVPAQRELAGFARAMSRD